MAHGSISLWRSRMYLPEGGPKRGQNAIKTRLRMRPSKPPVYIWSRHLETVWICRCNECPWNDCWSKEPAHPVNISGSKSSKSFENEVSPKNENCAMMRHICSMYQCFSVAQSGSVSVGQNEATLLTHWAQAWNWARLKSTIDYCPRFFLAQQIHLW